MLYLTLYYCMNLKNGGLVVVLHKKCYAFHHTFTNARKKKIKTKYRYSFQYSAINICKSNSFMQYNDKEITKIHFQS